MIKTDVDKQIVKALGKGGFEYVEDDSNVLILDRDTGARVALPYGRDNLMRVVNDLSRFGINLGRFIGDDITVERKPEPKPVDKAEGLYIVATSSKNVWFDVLDKDGNILSEKRLRKADAESFIENLNNSKVE